MTFKVQLCASHRSPEMGKAVKPNDGGPWKESVHSVSTSGHVNHTIGALISCFILNADNHTASQCRRESKKSVIL